MATITLAEASKLGLDDLVSGVIEDIVTVNQMYRVLPFQEISGNAKAYNRENTLGDAQVAAIGDTITAKNPPTYTRVTTELTTIIGDAEVNGLLQSQQVGANGGNDLVALQIASKAKSIGRKYQDLMINGDSVNAGEFDGLDKLVIAGQTVDGGAAALSFEMLDETLHLVKSKDGQVDFMVMNSTDIRKYRSLVRALGGSQPEYVEVAGVNTVAYGGVPIFRNDWVAAGTIFAGNFDDGSERVGMAGLTSATNMGIHVQNVGASETKDEDIWRVKFYSSFALYSNLAAAKLTNFA